MKNPILPGSFTNINPLIMATIKTWRKYFLTLVIYNLLIGFLAMIMMWYCNSLIFSYLIKAEESGKIPSEFLTRLLLMGEIGTFIAFFPLVLLCSFFALWQLGTEPNPPDSAPLKTLIKKSSSASILLSSGWMHAIIKAANPIFLVLIFLCISGFLSGKYQYAWLDISLILLNSVWFSLLLLRLSMLFALPWLALVSTPTEIKRSKLEIKDGAQWLIFISWGMALTVLVLLQNYFRFDKEQANITYQLIKQAINVYVPQPFLWFIAVVAREYAVLVPRKSWSKTRSSSNN